MTQDLRPTGISVVGHVPWGTHFSVFYESTADFIDVIVPYFKAGLESGESCLCMIGRHIGEDEVVQALSRVIPDLDRYRDGGALEIVDAENFYLGAGAFDPATTTGDLRERRQRARAAGFTGLRVSGDEAWLERKNRTAFSEYEQALGDSIASTPSIVLCAYRLDDSLPSQILDIAQSHEFVVAKRGGHWERLETTALKESKQELQAWRDELQRRVAERTRELERTNDQLRTEIMERKQVERALQAASDQLTALSRRLVEIQESERRHLARELHDRVGQNLTALGINLDIVSARCAGRADGEVMSRLKDSVALLEATADAIVNVLSDLRPPMLDDLGLLPALEWYAKEFSTRTGIDVAVAGEEQMRRPPPEAETALFRIAQEALNNVAKHAHARSVDIELTSNGEWVLCVSDNGVGLEPTPQPQSQPQSRFGMVTMRERALAIGGRFEIVPRPGGGTSVVVRVREP